MGRSSDISIAIISGSQEFAHRLQGLPHKGFQFKSSDARRMDVLCFGPDTSEAQFRKWRTRFPKSGWIWFRQHWSAQDLETLSSDLPGVVLALEPDSSVERAWAGALDSIRNDQFAKASKRDLRDTASNLEGLMSFIKTITGARTVFDLLRHLRRELRELKVEGDPVLLLAKSHSPSELYYFRGTQAHTRGIASIPAQGQRVRMDDPVDRQFLADHLGRPFGKVIAFPLAQEPGAGWQVRPIVFFENQKDDLDLSEFVDQLGQRMQAMSLVLDRLVLEAELTRSSRLWERTFDSIEEPIAIVGLDGELVRSNRRFMSLDLNGSEHGFIKNAAALFNVERFDIRIKNQGPILSTVVHYHDVTRPMNLRERMIQTEKMSAIGHLAGHVAHELNNPLTGIRSLAQSLIQDIPSRNRLRDDLTEVERAATRCQDIILNLLDFSKGNLDSKTTRCDLNEIVRKTLPFLKSAVGRHSNHVELQTGPLFVDVEPQLMQQVVFNLVNNACQALAGTSGHLEVRTDSEVVGGRSMAVLVVSDDGPGIPKNLQNLIFEPFFTTKKEGQGTGLGLSFCRDFIRRLGGEVVCESDVGQGARFRVTLPLAEATSLGEAS